MTGAGLTEPSDLSWETGQVWRQKALKRNEFLTNEQWLQHQYAEKGSAVSFVPFVIGQRQTQGSCTSSIKSFQTSVFYLHFKVAHAKINEEFLETLIRF